MRPDERQFLLTLLAERGCRGRFRRSPRQLARDLGMNEERAIYLCGKWTEKGWYDWGVSVAAGWLTDEGVEAARALREGLKEPASRGVNEEGKG